MYYRTLQRNRLEQFCEQAHQIKAGKHRDSYQRDGGHDLNKDIQAGTNGILQRISHGIADNGSIMSGGVFTGTFYTAGFNELLTVVPGAAGITAENGNHNRCQRGANDQAANKVRAKKEAAADRSHDGQQAGGLHFPDGALGGNTDTGFVIRLGCTVQNTGDLPELAVFN